MDPAIPVKALTHARIGTFSFVMHFMGSNLVIAARCHVLRVQLLISMLNEMSGDIMGVRVRARVSICPSAGLPESTVEFFRGNWARIM